MLKMEEALLLPFFPFFVKARSFEVSPKELFFLPLVTTLGPPITVFSSSAIEIDVLIEKIGGQGRFFFFLSSSEFKQKGTRS